MQDKIRKSLPTKIAAVGFIAITLAGNFWLVNLLLGTSPHPIVVFLFFVGVATALFGGLGLALIYVKELQKKE